MNIVYYVTTFITNLLMTGLVSLRIWWVVRKMRREAGVMYGSKYLRVVHILIESGALYAALLLISMSSSGNTLGDVASVLLVMSTGLVPTLIVILVALGRSAEYTTSGGSDTVVLTMGMQFAEAPHSAAEEQNIELRALHLRPTATTLNSDAEEEHVPAGDTREKKSDLVPV
ncbi:hypothetical protein GLOTRDRAFT_124943 [Gloeophyllum trabeum ATCC 11539]|uniref:Uncharacterized protein n=1 Tax=Gloeophyllum trabeum (strain ATCC 11539 / FP-39264 / Madison 617) TaxID=670483 RepID=S7QNW1_GLOTA|nr:uncharacterized protein GLOTRDRAFT_124943 [Gloeophyllum trabeum ATCC 11539]EPQ61213.1 hypothetical protein GLOTRDRAFT_124943 [Gloeophyllum trabeum ATCC 11539]